MDLDYALEMKEAAIQKGQKPRVFDWNKAARIIKDKHPAIAWAGLMEDLACTVVKIREDGKPVKNTKEGYLYSVWATPILMFPSGYMVECWKNADDVPEWGAHTRWPESALKILKEEETEDD